MCASPPLSIRRGLMNDHGILPAYAWPGGAPILYMAEDRTCAPYHIREIILCASCASQASRALYPLIGHGTNEEGSCETCEHCLRPLPALYGNPRVLDGIDVEDLPQEWQDADSDIRVEWATDQETGQAWLEYLRSHLRYKYERLRDSEQVNRREDRIRACADTMCGILWGHMARGAHMLHLRREAWRVLDSCGLIPQGESHEDLTLDPEGF